MTRESTHEAIPEADRQEQDTPPGRDPRLGHVHLTDKPEADALEQETPVLEVDESPTGLDVDRLEPIDETDSYGIDETGSYGDEVDG